MATDKAGVASSNVDQEQTASEDENLDYASPRRLAVIVTSICCASFLCGLDQTIVASAAPKIASSFNALGNIGWSTSAYLLTSASLQLVYGRLYTLFPEKWIYIFAIIVFSVGSLICTVAPNSKALVVGRAIAGCGAAGIMSGLVLILADSSPLDKRASLSGLMFMSLGIAAVAGPFIGGALADRATWRWCFGINLPICATISLGICLAVKVPPRRTRFKTSWQEKLRHFDLPGTIQLTAALVCIILALQLGGTVYTWSNARVIALFVVSGVLFLSFAAIQIRVPSQRSFSPGLIRNRNVSLSALYSGFISGGMFVVITYFLFGVMITPLIASFVVMPAVSGGVTQAIIYYNPALFLGAILSAVGSGFISTFTPSISSAKWIGYQVIYGLGAGAGMPPPMLVIQTTLLSSDVPLGVSLVNLTQMLCSSVVVAIAQSVFVNDLEDAISTALPGFDKSRLIRSGATNLSSMYSSQDLERVIPAYSEAITKTFYITIALSCGAFLLALPVQWTSMKKNEKNK